MSETRGFRLIDDTTPRVETPAAPAADEAQSRAMLMIALRALSQRTLTAITNGFSLLLAGSVLAALWRVLDDPTENRLIATGGYAVFCLTLDYIRRRK